MYIYRYKQSWVHHYAALDYVIILLISINCVNLHIPHVDMIVTGKIIIMMRLHLFTCMHMYVCVCLHAYASIHASNICHSFAKSSYVLTKPIHISGRLYPFLNLLSKLFFSLLFNISYAQLILMVNPLTFNVILSGLNPIPSCHITSPGSSPLELMKEKKSESKRCEFCELHQLCISAWGILRMANKIKRNMEGSIAKSIWSITQEH